MPHVAADRVRETTTTTGTGALTLAGAVGGYRAFGDVCANADTVLYSISHRTAAEWETGLGTWATGGTLTRTTVFASSNAGAAVSFSAGTKDVAIVSPAVAQSFGGVEVAPSTNQNDYNPAGYGYSANRICITPTATIKITGLANGVAGRQVTLHNNSTDFLIWLEHENTASAAANRFSLPSRFPAFIMPGDRITFVWDGMSQRWELFSWPNQGAAMGLTVFSDFGEGTTGPFTSTVSGTSAATAASTYLVGTTERPMGVTQGTTGTTNTGRATIGHAGTDSIVPTLGPALSVARLAAQAANSGTETWQLISGFADCSGGTFTDGVAWNLRWNGTTAEWSQDRLANAVATRSTTGSPTPDTNYLWVVVFVNSTWTRADFIYSTDSLTFTLADSPTTGIPGNTRNTAWVAASIIKSAGTTARLFSLDLAGFRVDHTRA